MGYLKGIVFLVLVLGFSQAQEAPSADCQIWKVPVEVDPPKHNHRPYYVEMHRCMGQCTTKPVMSPLQCECVPATTKNVTLRFITASGTKSRNVLNHTSCRSQCKASHKNRCNNEGYTWHEHSCTCNCNQPLSGPCPTNQFWNTRSCQCQCNSSPSICSASMVWNKSSCSCQCTMSALTKCYNQNKDINLKTCQCTRRRRQTPATGQSAKSESNESETKLVVSLVVIGLLLGTLFIIDLVLMCSRKGFMYGLVTKCSERKGNKDCINQAEAETGSITLDMDVNRPENCKHKNHYTTQDSITNV